MKASNKEKKYKKVSKKDITALGYRSLLNQAIFNYERMQNIGFTATLTPCLKKIYKDDKKKLAEVTEDNLEFINTHNVLVPFLEGLMVSLYEGDEDPETVKKIKISMFGPLAGIGDAIFWFTVMPIMSGICASLDSEGNILGPILYFLVFLAVFLLRFPLAHMGYSAGVSALDKIQANTEKVGNAASILGVTILGGLIASYVSITLLPQIEISDGTFISLQTDLVDKIIPNLLPFAFTFLIYFLLKKKVNPTVLILSTLVVSVLLAFFGIL